MLEEPTTSPGQGIRLFRSKLQPCRFAVFRITYLAFSLCTCQSKKTTKSIAALQGQRKWSTKLRAHRASLARLRTRVANATTAAFYIRITIRWYQLIFEFEEGGQDEDTLVPTRSSCTSTRAVHEEPFGSCALSIIPQGAGLAGLATFAHLQQKNELY